MHTYEVTRLRANKLLMTNKGGGGEVELTSEMVREVKRAFWEFDRFVGDERLIYGLWVKAWSGQLGPVKSMNQRLLAVRMVLREMGYDVPFKVYKSNNEYREEG